MGLRRANISYQSKFVPLHDAPLRIAEFLEAEGWPARGSPAYHAAYRVTELEHQLTRAEDLLIRTVARAKQNSLFEPSVKQAIALRDKAATRLAAARAELTRHVGGRVSVAF